MNGAPEHIGVFQSKGRDFAQALRLLREANPTARLCAIVPRGYAVGDTLRSLADEVVTTECASYSLRDPGAGMRLVGTLRGKHFDRFVVLFPSVRLRAVAALSGAKTCICLGPRGRFVRMGRHLLPVMARWVAQKVAGRVLYGWLWIVVRAVPARGVRRPLDRSESQ